MSLTSTLRIRRPAADGTIQVNHDTGESSKAMLKVLAKAAGQKIFVSVDPQAYPCDPSDFGRCVKLLEAAPALREHLPTMAAVSPIWAAYVARWPEMESLYAEEFPTGEAPKLYKLMQEIRDAHQ